MWISRQVCEILGFHYGKYEDETVFLGVSIPRTDTYTIYLIFLKDFSVNLHSKYGQSL